jgi:hypothetical protein
MILSSPSSPLCALYTPLIVPDKTRDAGERLYGEVGAGSSLVFQGSDSTIEP